MTDNPPQANGARVLADLNALRSIGAYKTGVHKPTFSEPHMRSVEWLAQRLPEAALTATVDGIGNVLGTSTKSGPKAARRVASRKPELRRLARWAAWRHLCPRSRPNVINPDPSSKGAVEVAAWCDEEGHFGSFLGSRSYVGGIRRSGHRRRARQQRPNHAGCPARCRPCWPGAARRPNAAGTSDISRPISSRAGRSKARGLRIGVVTSIVGIWQYRITFSGEQNHAGTTRMADRRDAGLALARFCVAIDDRLPAHCGPAHGMDHGPHHPRSRRAEHHSGTRGNAVPDARRRRGCDRAA